jgi:hypothetical protein
MAAWVVTNQRQTTAQDSTGKYVPVVAVTFQLASGTTATVTVPVSVYSQANVTAAIDAYAAQLAAVDGLSSS